MAVSARGLAASYGKRDALRGVWLDAPSGSITALCGANGSGKTTLCKVLAGLIQPRRGEARILGRTDTWAAKADVCYHSARPFFEPGAERAGPGAGDPACVRATICPCAKPCWSASPFPGTSAWARSPRGAWPWRCSA